MDFIGLKQGCMVLLSPRDEAEALSNGEYSIVLKRPRNYQFHKKYFALLNSAYRLWEAPEGAEKSFDLFRSEVIILAGYYDSCYSVEGCLKLVAKSISFAKMTQPEFEQLYNKTINVILHKVLPNHDRESLLKMEEQILGFA